MSNSVSQLEQEYLLRQAVQKQLALTLSIGEDQASSWTVRLEQDSPGRLDVVHSIPLHLQRKNQRLQFSWSHGGSQYLFSSPLLAPGSGRMQVGWPKQIQKTVQRSFARLSPPESLRISFSIEGSRYDLAFPQVQDPQASAEPQLAEGFDIKDLHGLLREFSQRCKGLADEKKISMYRDRRPETVPERLCSSLGRCLYLPTVMAGVPRSDPFAEASLITRKQCAQWLAEQRGQEADGEYLLRELEQGWRHAGYGSLVYVPVLFQHYSIGMIFVAVREPNRPPLDLQTVEELLRFSKILSRALHIHGYFKDAPVLERDFRPLIANVSAGGLLFSTNDPKLLVQLREGSSVSVQMQAGKRSLNAGGRVQRVYADQSEGFFGLQFTNMALEDFRFLFEYLYKRPFSDADGASLEVQRILANQ